MHIIINMVLFAVIGGVLGAFKDSLRLGLVLGRLIVGCRYPG